MYFTIIDTIVDKTSQIFTESLDSLMKKISIKEEIVNFQMLEPSHCLLVIDSQNHGNITTHIFSYQVIILKLRSEKKQQVQNKLLQPKKVSEKLELELNKTWQMMSCKWIPSLSIL